VQDAARRADLVNAAAEYVLAHGLAALSVRPLAAALGLSHRTLLYHFETKDKLVLEILDVIRARDAVHIRELLAAADLTSLRALLRTAWVHFSAPERVPYMRFFHEVLALGLQGAPYDAWARTIVVGRSEMIVAALVARGMTAPRARATATLVTAAVRGLQLHLLTLGEPALTDAAFEELLSLFPE